MNQSVLVLSRDESLVNDITRELDGKHDTVICDSLDSLHTALETNSVQAVLVHLGTVTVNGYSAGRFIAELDESVDSAPMYGLVDSSCTPRLRKMADKTMDDFLALPDDFGQLQSLLNQQHDLERELDTFWSGMPHKELHGATRSLVTFTPEMFEMIDEIKVAAKHEVTALLIGETGSGKTFLARLIHELSERREERFCTVACGALPPDLIESELFGHEKGSFTGADRTREGKFAAAGNGTLLLDEIDVLPPDQQAKLLRVIETGEYEPVGSNDTQTSQARLIVASNYNLEDLVRAGTFRTDLYYRLNILNFRVTPLRERPWDIEYLARKFALEHSRTHGIHLRSIEPAFLEVLRKYQWPGNIREMENVIRRAVLYCQRGVLTLGDLPSSIRAAAQGTPAMSQANGAVQHGGIQPGAPVLGNHVGANRGSRHAVAQAVGSDGSTQAGTPLNGNSNPVMPSNGNGHGHLPSSSSTDPAQNGGQPVSLEQRVDQLEQRIIEDSLRRNNHRRKETAAELGISRVTLYNKMKKFGLL